jgi:hypothetical protein
MDTQLDPIRSMKQTIEDRFDWDYEACPNNTLIITSNIPNINDNIEAGKRPIEAVRMIGVVCGITFPKQR